MTDLLPEASDGGADDGHAMGKGERRDARLTGLNVRCDSGVMAGKELADFSISLPAVNDRGSVPAEHFPAWAQLALARDCQLNRHSPPTQFDEGISQ